MHRQDLLKTIAGYRQRWLAPGVDHASRAPEAEQAVLNHFQTFINATPDCFERHSPLGHITGSALVASPDLERVLLTLHGKLNKWLQLGGHSDGSPHPLQVAYREVEEESGLASFEFLRFDQVFVGLPAANAGDPPLPFDFDHHEIPARPREPAHIHYDVRYLIVADDRQPLVISHESKDLRWFTLEEARAVTQEPSMTRQFDKLEWLKRRLG